jgi:hypothetical protein
MNTDPPIIKGYAMTTEQWGMGKRRSKTSHLIYTLPWLHHINVGIQVCDGKWKQTRRLYETGGCVKCHNLNRNKKENTKQSLDYKSPVTATEVAAMLSWHIEEHIIKPEILIDPPVVRSLRVVKHHHKIYINALAKLVPSYTISKTERENIRKILPPSCEHYQLTNLVELPDFSNRHEALTYINRIDAWPDLQKYLQICKTLDRIYNKVGKRTEEITADLVSLKLGVF